MPGGEALARLQARPSGLSGEEAEGRLARHGPNSLPVGSRRGPVRRFAAQFDNVLIYVLMGAAAVTASLGHWVDTAVILAVVLANAVVGFIQEGKAEAAMAAIRDLLAPRAAVLRDGRRVTLITGITPDLALALRPTEPATMRRPPRPRGAPIPSAELRWHVILITAARFAVTCLAPRQAIPGRVAVPMADRLLIVGARVFFLALLEGERRSRLWVLGADRHESA
jgi:magnesium-transporting ATPase (P-type)